MSNNENMVDDTNDAFSEDDFIDSDSFADESSVPVESSSKRDFRKCPEGKYPARAITWGLQETQNGNICMVINHQLLVDNGGGNFSDYLDANGRPVMQQTNLYFTEKTEKRSYESLFYHGWTGSDVENLVSLGEDPSVAAEAGVNGLGSKVVELVLEDNEYNGTLSTRTQYVNRYGGLRIQRPVEGDKLKLFKMRSIKQIEALRHAEKSGQKTTEAATNARTMASKADPAKKPAVATAKNGARKPEPKPAASEDDINF